MSTVAILASRSILLLIIGFIVVVVWQLFTNRISLAGLLQDDQENFSAGRAQMLMVTLMTAMQYVIQVTQKPTVFPEIPTIWLAALGASHGVYLGGKAQALLFGNRSDQS
jgi:hypothetical protein